MLRVNGFYGHIMRNHFRSVWIFIGFAIAFQLVCGVLLAPILLFTAPETMIFVAPFVFLQTYGFYVLIFSAVVFVGSYMLHVQDLQRDIGFRYVSKLEEPRLTRIVEPIAITAGIKVPKIAVLEIEELNAFVCGLGEGSATLVVTRGLINTLDDDELGAVMAHEIAHIMNGDMRMMAFANVSISSLKLLKKVNLVKITSSKGVLVAILFPPILILFLSVGFVMSVAMTLAKVSRLMIASSREFIADAEAVRLTHNPSALITALQKIEGRSHIEWLDPISDAMMIDGAVEGELASHPTIGERLRKLMEHSGGMAFATGPRKDTRFSAQLRSGNQYTPSFGANGGSFGRRQNFNPDHYQPSSFEQDKNPLAKARNLIDRVNSDSTENAFGLSHAVRKKLLIGLAIFIAFSIISQYMMFHNFKGISNHLNRGGIQTVESDLIIN